MRYLLIIMLLSITTACAPIIPNENNQYKLVAYSNDKISNQKTDMTILVSQTQAISGYQTEQMLYTNKPYQLSSFVKNSWMSPPAAMLTPLIVQSLQFSNYFFAIASGPDVDKTDYKLETQIISFQQNFLTKPSQIELSIQASISHTDDNRLIASKTFVINTPCMNNSPYSGVVAANNAVHVFTKELTNYVISQIRMDNK